DRAEKAQKLAEGRAEEIRQGLERLKAANALLDRGRAYAGLRSWDDAHAALTQAIQLYPDHVAVWYERGELFLRLGLWDLAAADLAREFALREPNGADRWLYLALLYASLGDGDGYRRLLPRIRARCHGDVDPPSLLSMARACALAPAP